jgi:hypothetical protein
MLTVIIPSLLRIPRLFQTISELSSSPVVGEIILIDNSTNTQELQLPKLRHIIEGKNTYINPAWNKGASLARFEKLCFMNDDIWFDWRYLDLIEKEITEDKLMIGMSAENYKNPSSEFKISTIEKHPNTNKVHRPDGFGCCWFIHKKNYRMIPEELKLWCGDDWIFFYNRENNFKIEGIHCHGLVSATLNADDLKLEFDPIKQNDMAVMRRFVNEGKIDNMFFGSWWELNK